MRRYFTTDARSTHVQNTATNNPSNEEQGRTGNQCEKWVQRSSVSAAQMVRFRATSPRRNHQKRAVENDKVGQEKGDKAQPISIPDRQMRAKEVPISSQRRSTKEMFQPVDDDRRMRPSLTTESRLRQPPPPEHRPDHNVTNAMMKNRRSRSRSAPHRRDAAYPDKDPGHHAVLSSRRSTSKDGLVPALELPGVAAGIPECLDPSALPLYGSIDTHADLDLIRAKIGKGCIRNLLKT